MSDRAQARNELRAMIQQLGQRVEHLDQKVDRFREELAPGSPTWKSLSTSSLMPWTSGSRPKMIALTPWGHGVAAVRVAGGHSDHGAGGGGQRPHCRPAAVIAVFVGRCFRNGSSLGKRLQGAQCPGDGREARGSRERRGASRSVGEIASSLDALADCSIVRFVGFNWGARTLVISRQSECPDEPVHYTRRLSHTGFPPRRLLGLQSRNLGDQRYGV